MKKLTILFIGLLTFSGLYSQQIGVKYTAYNIQISDSGVSYPKRLSDAIYWGAKLTHYKFNGKEHIILNPNDTTYFPTAHLIKKDNKWQFEKNYFSGLVEAPHTCMPLDNNGNFVLGSFQDHMQWKYELGKLYHIQTINDTLKIKIISNKDGEYSDVGVGDLNLDGFNDVVSYEGSVPLDQGSFGQGASNSIVTYIQNKTRDFTRASLMPDFIWHFNASNLESAVITRGYALTVGTLFKNDKYPQIIRGQYSSDPGSRFGIAIHSYNPQTGLFDSTKILSKLGAYEDLTRGTSKVDIVDINNDGNNDLAVKYEGGNGNFLFQIFLNDGKNDFIPGQIITYAAEEWNDMGWIIVDLNDDGYKDFVFHPLGGTKFYLNSCCPGLRQQGVILNNFIFLNNKGTLEALKTNLTFAGLKPNNLHATYIDNQIKFLGFGYPTDSGDPDLSAPNGLMRLYEFDLTFCKNLIKPTFNTSKYSFCNGDSLKLSVTNVNKGDTLKWYFGTKSDLMNVSNKTFTDSTKLFVTRTDSLGCIISSDTIQISKSSIPNAPTLARDSSNNLAANINGITWYKDGVKISDTTQKIKPTSNGNYTATTTQNGCTSPVSANYYYLTSAVANLSGNDYFKISPNPTNGDIYLNYIIRSTKDVFINVIDMSGRTIISNRKVNSGAKVNLGSSMKGNYIIQMKDKTGRLLTTEKLIKN